MKHNNKKSSKYKQWSILARSSFCKNVSTNEEFRLNAGHLIQSVFDEINLQEIEQ